MLYDYTASIIGQLFPAAIRFTVRWHFSIIPFPDGWYAQLGQNRMPHSSTHRLDCWLQKAMSLLVIRFTGAPHSKNTDSNCLITCAASCRTSGRLIENRVRSRSIRVKSGDRFSADSKFPAHWVLLSAIASELDLNDQSYCCFRQGRIDPMLQIQCALNSIMPAVSMILD